MCGRYSFAPDLEIVNEHYNITVKDGDISPNYNCAPSQNLPVITNEDPGEIKFFRWGLIPFWAKDKSIGNKLINARGETIAEKASFKNAFRHRRCLVPADAFYEWKKNSTDKKKIPYRIYLTDQPVFSMAGIWESWKSPEGEALNTFSIITTKPNVLMAEIHDRMPVILPESAEQTWLQSTDESELTGLLKPFPAKAMSAYRISDLVNSPRNNSAKIIQPEVLPDLFH
jgi:putative SOS response-associated peptidase YedK